MYLDILSGTVWTGSEQTGIHLQYSRQRFMSVSQEEWVGAQFYMS